ncbi:MAG: ABC transporter permease, partial [Actinomycetota bacterium]|nr:ABC transporter permease [Actinomycetota bacterium]
MIKFLAIAIKDVKTWVRDPAALGILLGMPAILILILGSAFGGLSGGNTGGGISVAIVNLDQGSSAGSVSGASGASSVLGDEVVAALVGNDQLASLLDITESSDPEAVRADVERGDLPAALIIPADFSDRVNSAQSVELEVLRDPGSELASGIFETVVRSIATEFSRISVIARTAGAAAAQADSSQVDITGAVVSQAIEAAASEDAVAPIAITASEAQEADAQGEGSLDYFSVSMTSMFLLFASMFGAFSFITEKRELTMSRLLTTPTPGSAFIGGKMLGIFMLGILQFTVLYVYTRTMMGVSWGDSVAGTWMMAIG